MSSTCCLPNHALRLLSFAGLRYQHQPHTRPSFQRFVLQEGQHVIGDAYDHVVIMFSDIVGFSTMSSTMSAVEVFLMLTNLYYAFDRLVDKYGVYKVETIGDGYMIAAGETLHQQPLKHLPNEEIRFFCP